MKRIAYCACAIVLLLAGLNAQDPGRQIPPPRYLTDEEAIFILLYNIREGIRQQDLLLITDGFAPEVELAGETVSRAEAWDRLKASFDALADRAEDPRFRALTPRGMEVTTTWDFGLKIDSLTIAGNTATAHTRATFSVEEPDREAVAEPGLTTDEPAETIHLEKIGGEWRVVRLLSIVNALTELSASDER